MNQETKKKKIKELESRLQELTDKWKDKETIPGTVEHVQKKIARVQYSRIQKKIRTVKKFGWKPPEDFKKKANIAEIFGGVPRSLSPQEKRNYSKAVEAGALVWKFENGKLNKLL